MSEWLQSLGKAASSAPDISKWNYSEFESEDRVEQINKQNDEIAKSITDEAEAAARWYEQHSRNKSNQYQQLANLTKSGVDTINKVSTWAKNERLYNESLKKLLLEENLDDDPDVETEQEKENKLANLKARAQLTAWGLPQDLANEALALNGLTKANFDTKEEVRNLMQRVYPSWVATLSEKEFTLSDGTKATISKPDLSPAQYDELQGIINKLFLQQLDGFGYSKGFLKKYVLKPMFEESRKGAVEYAQVKAKADATAMEGIRLREFSTDLKSGNTEVILSRINTLHAKGDVSWKQARDITFSEIRLALQQNLLDVKDIQKLGELEFKDHNNKMVRLEEYWGPEFQILIHQANGLKTQEIDMKVRAQQAEKDQFIIEYNEDWEKLDKPLTLKQVDKAIINFKKNFKGHSVPQEWLNLKDYLANPNQQEQIADLERKYKLGQTIRWNDVAMLTGRDREIWINRVGTSQPDTHPLYGKNVTQSNVIAETNKYFTAFGRSADIKGNTLLYRNVGQGAYGAFRNGWTEAMDFYAEDNTLSLEQKFQKAMEAGTSSMNNYLEKTVGTLDKSGAPSGVENPNLKSLGTQRGISDKDAQYIKDVNVFRKGIGASDTGRIDLDSSDYLFDGEEVYLGRALNYAKDPVNTPIPEFWRKAASKSNVSAQDLIMRRLEATGMLEKEGIEPTYTEELTTLSKNTRELLQKGGISPSRTYVAMNQNQADLAKIMQIASVNRDSGGYGALVDSQGTAIELPEELKNKTVDQMSIKEIVTLAQKYPDARIGMYGIRAGDLIGENSLLAGIIPREGEEPSAGGYAYSTEGLFDQDFQDRLLFHSLRTKCDATKTNSGIDVSWCTTNRLDPTATKQFNELYSPWKDYPMNHLENLLPDIGRVVVTNY